MSYKNIYGELIETTVVLTSTFPSTSSDRHADLEFSEAVTEMLRFFPQNGERRMIWGNEVNVYVLISKRTLWRSRHLMSANLLLP